MINEYQINYTACADLSREISSQIRYIESIQERMMRCKDNINMLNVDAKKRCDSGAIIRNIYHLNNYFDYEKQRYTRLKTQFENYYHYVEETEEALMQSLQTHSNLLSQQKNNEVFLKARIDWFEMEKSFQYTEDTLMKNGLSKQEAHEIMALLTQEGQEKIKYLATCSQDELEKEKAKLKENSSTLLDQMIEKILKQKEPRKVLSQLSKCLSDNNFSGYIEEAILGVSKETMINFQLLFQNMDMSSFSANSDVIGVMKQEDFLKVGASVEKQSCYQLFKKASHSIQTVNNVISKVYNVVDFESKAKEYYNEYEFYGADAFEAGYGFVFDKLSSVAGSAVGSSLGKIIGVRIGAFIGVAGGPIGIVVGVVAGGVIGAALGVAFNEMSKKSYKEIVNPARNWWKDACNDIEDWWNMQWW